MEIKDIVLAVIVVGLVLIYFFMKLSSYQSAKAQKTGSYATIATAVVFSLIVLGWLATQYDYNKMSASMKGGKLEISLQKSNHEEKDSSVSYDSTESIHIPVKEINNGLKAIAFLSGKLENILKPDKPDSL